MSDSPEAEKVVVNDRRRINPETGELKDTSELELDSEVNQESTANSPEVEKIAELTDNLQRLQADFTNYKRRSEKDKLALMDTAKSFIAAQFLPILDDLDRAESFNDLKDHPLASIVEKLRQTIIGLGLEQFGQAGDIFDPNLHEAVQNEGSGDSLVIDTVLRVGYKQGDKVLRNALVTVTDASYDKSQTNESVESESLNQDEES